MPTWTTANRPTSPIIGAQGYNTTYGGVEVYNGSAWDLITGGPAFSAYLSTTQGITTATQTKISFDTKIFDTNNCFNTSTNRFTPTVPGYYQINLNVQGSSSSYSSMQIYFLYKNGNPYVKSDWRYSSAIVDTGSGDISSLIYMNGTTDYIEAYAYIVASSSPTVSSSSTTQLSGAFVRGQ
jgi:hypothetical protein